MKVNEGNTFIGPLLGLRGAKLTHSLTVSHFGKIWNSVKYSFCTARYIICKCAYMHTCNYMQIWVCSVSEIWDVEERSNEGANLHAPWPFLAEFIISYLHPVERIFGIVKIGDLEISGDFLLSTLLAALHHLLSDFYFCKIPDLQSFMLIFFPVINWPLDMWLHFP